MATFIPNVTDVFPEPSLFTPDFSFMDKMLQRRQALYDQGFSQVNSAYNYVNRETTNPYNTKVKDQFLRQAKDNLKNLSSMDLSQFQNVEAANSVFAPFHNNTDVIGDQAITEHWNREVSLGNSFRTKDGGKEFNQTNIDYILQQKNWFAQDTPDSWKQYYQTKRSYTPYYDATKEVEEAMKNFKPDHTKLVYKDGFYIKTVDDKSWLPGQIAQYLNSVLSDKAKRQWQIEGAVKYGDNPTLLAQVLNTQVATNAPNLQSTIDDLNIDIRREKDPVKIAELTKKRDGYMQEQENINNNLNSIKSGDLKMLRMNSEKLAYDIYFNEKMTNLANGYSHKDIEQDIKFDDIAKMFWENDQKWALERQKHLWNMEEETHKADLKAKEGTYPLINVGGSSETVFNTKEDLLNNIKTLQGQTNTLKNDLVAYINTKMNRPEGSTVSVKEFYRFIKEHPDDDLVFAYTNNEVAVTSSKNAYASWGRSANMYAANKMGDDVFKEFYNLRKSGQTNTPRYKELQEAYSKYYNEFHSTTYTGTTATSMALALNPADKRWKAAAGAVQAFSGVDASLIGSIDYQPTIDGNTMRVTFQETTTDQTTGKQNQFNKVNAKAALENKMAPLGASVEWEGNTAIIKKAPAQLTGDFDPYSGFSYATRIQLFNMKVTNSPIYGKNMFWLPFKGHDGGNFHFKVVKQKMSTGDVYYLYNNRDKIITPTPLKGPADIAGLLKVLTARYNDDQLKNGVLNVK